MLVGYIRVSTDDQNLSLQKDALLKYGVDERNIFSDKTSGSKDKRVGLDKALEFLKDGDTLVVWKLDRLGRSLAHLISVIAKIGLNRTTMQELDRTQKRSLTGQ